jgi:hypothetical protein
MMVNLRRLDTNGDGFIDEEELGKLADRFYRSASQARFPATLQRLIFSSM